MISVLLIFSNCESTCGLTEVPALMYDRKIARPFDTAFYDVSVLCYRFLKARKAQIRASGNAGVKVN